MDKAEIYNNRIKKHVEEIADICEEEDIDFFTEFDLEDRLSRTLRSSGPRYRLYDVFAQCYEPDGFNLDKFVFWVKKNMENASSMVLHILFDSAEPEEIDEGDLEDPSGDRNININNIGG